LPAECILYFAVADVMTQRFFVEKIGDTNNQLTTKDIAVLRKRAQKQLDAMQNYARWERCRRRQILEYFGENKIPENCECDVCRAGRPVLRLTGVAAAAGAVKSTAKAPRVEPVESRGAVVTAGGDLRLARLKDLRRDVVRSLGTMFFQHMTDELLRELIANPPKSVEELRDDFEVHNKIVDNFGARIVHLLSTSGGQAQSSHVRRRPLEASYPAVHLSDESVARIAETVLRDETQKSKECTPRAKVRAAKEVAGGKVGVLHGKIVEARFERLRTLRLDLARKNHWPPYCVLQDTTLLEIARVQPRTMRELLEIKGMGPKRAERFGKELLAELANE